MICCKRLLLLAACVRTVYLASNLLLACYIMDYDTSASLLSESCEDSWPEAVATIQQQHPWVVWDSVFMHRIAACGYEHEQFFAFFPAFSGLVRLVRATGLLPSAWGFTIAALVINNCLFLLSALLLARLSERFVNDDKLAVTAVIFFIVNPASIHHSMMYTEALFTASSWLGLYCLYCRGDSLLASLAFAVSAGTRSNGVLNAGFLLHEHGRRFLQAWPCNKVHASCHLTQALLFSAITVAPYVAYTWFGYWQFCTGVYAEQQRPWCSKTLPSAYGYVQDAYWNVGFLRYYEWNQIPNFLIAAPTLIMSLWGPLAYACANPHLFITGGLLSQQQLAHWFSSGSSFSRKRISKTSKQLQQQQQQGDADAVQHRENNSSSSCCSGTGWCALFAPVLVGHKQMMMSRGSRKLSHTNSDSSSKAVASGTAAAAADGAHLTSSVRLPAQQQLRNNKDKNIKGVSYQPLRERQFEVSSFGKGSEVLPAVDRSSKQQQQDDEQQQQQGGTCTPSCCSCGTGDSYYSPGVAVFVIHWLLLTLVCLAIVHIQVSTRFLSSCVPLYWFAAALMLHKGGLLRWLLWWYCFAFMGVGAVFFTNFYPWT